ncbi:type I-C CRISPR-associated protein Cas8c/Csd1 [Paenibacillus sp. SGZ-1009]|uniref:type I-C CRISPR-associated protein Cas8c/Csd1 n=1 Tax=Paenibacillus campi TaxID=3106031 RepID=UPI002AFF3A4B|nr:type I-C CRISPR-associated protein Cas8c/Csd1 [Paenibacillus sp. SGZ-1009]
MNWLQSLYATFENNKQVVGQFQTNKRGREYALIPVAHTTQAAHIEIMLNENGDLLSAKVIEKALNSTILPTTEDSASRGNGINPFPLHDKLQYISVDFNKYCPNNEKKEKNKDISKYNDINLHHQHYMENLKAWCDSPFAHPKVQAVYRYLAKGTLIHDLVQREILHVGEDGKLLDKWTTEMGEKPAIFKVIAGDQSAAFVRFAVNVPGEPESRLWRDPSVQQSFIAFYEQQLGQPELCYVTGKMLPYADKHTSRIRNSGDKAKLISANDTSGFTYRGRFHHSTDAAVVSYEVSQKAHNALKWLVERQGIPVDSKVFLVWGTDRPDVPEAFADSYDVCVQAHEVNHTELNTHSTEINKWTADTWQPDAERDTASQHAALGGDRTHSAFAQQIRKAINGFRYDAQYESDIIVMILDAATPGRLSIVYYQDLKRNQFLDQLLDWHETCFWQHAYRKDDHKQRLIFSGAPSTRDIAWAAYGAQASDKLIKELMERMLPSIIQGRAIPQDIVRSAMQRASNPVSMDYWEWEKTLSITCALINKQSIDQQRRQASSTTGNEHTDTFHSSHINDKQEGFSVAIDTELEDRSYLFGRMLAIADVLERRALGKEEKRATNAIRYMNAFARHPMRTWSIIQQNLQPYQARLGLAATYYNMLLDEVGSKLRPQDFNNEPLTGLYLLGFYSQRHDLYTSKKAKDAALTDDEQTASDQDEQGSE